MEKCKTSFSPRTKKILFVICFDEILMIKRYFLNDPYLKFLVKILITDAPKNHFGNHFQKSPYFLHK